MFGAQKHQWLALIPLSWLKYWDESANFVIVWQFCPWRWAGVTSLGLVGATRGISRVGVAHVPWHTFGAQQHQWLALIPLSWLKYWDESANFVIVWQFCPWIWPGVTSMGLVDATRGISGVAHVP